SRYPAVPPPHVKAFPEILGHNSYYTINQGKTDYQLSDLSTLWDENEPHPDTKMPPNKRFS
ncbi:MAG: sulfatase, partial [Pseudomonadota bacterium]